MRAAVDAANITRANLHELLSAYKDTETGERGFLLTGRQVFLEPYTLGRSVIEALLPRLQADLQENPRQAQRFRELIALDNEEAQFQRDRIKQRTGIHQSDIAASEHGKKLMDEVRAKIAELVTAERARRDELNQKVIHLENWSRTSLVLITALDLIFFGIIFYLMGRSLQSQLKAKNASIALNKNLADEVALRTEAMARLEQQSNRLNKIVAIQTELAQTQLDVGAFMNEVVQCMITLTPATGAVIEMLEDDHMLYVAASGSLVSSIGFRLPQRGSLSGLCIAETEVLIAADTRNDPRVNREACEKVGAESMVVAPLIRAGEVIGVLKIIGNTPNALDDDAVKTLLLMAGFLGAALGTQVQFQKNQTLLTERSITLTALNRELRRREEYEHILTNQRQTLRTITNTIPAVVALLDGNENFIYCNNEYARVSGIALDNIIGHKLQECLSRAIYTSSKPYFDRALAGEAVTYENTAETAIGLRHHECRLIPQFDANDKPDGFYLIAWDVTERKMQEIEWQSRASIDQLTGLFNRTSFNDALNRAIALRKRTSSSIAVLYLDVDRFKHINDTYGHAAGDTLLKAFADYLRQSVRDTDVIGRLGGDEFCILLDDIKTAANAIAVAEKILVSVRTPVAFEQQDLSISTSIGIAFAAESRPSATQMIAIADAALYKAKQAGRNCYALENATADQKTTVQS